MNLGFYISRPNQVIINRKFRIATIDREDFDLKSMQTPLERVAIFLVDNFDKNVMVSENFEEMFILRQFMWVFRE